MFEAFKRYIQYIVSCMQVIWLFGKSIHEYKVISAFLLDMINVRESCFWQ